MMHTYGNTHVVCSESYSPPQTHGISLAHTTQRLSTGDRMRKWGCDQHCVLCGDTNETRDHLFFDCPYSSTVWTHISSRLLPSCTTPDWTTVLTSLVALKCDIKDIILCKLAFQTTFYHIWRERNARVHGSEAKGATRLTRLIDKSIRNRISSLHYNPPHKLQGLMQRWFETRMS